MAHKWKLEVDSYGFVLAILYLLITVTCAFQIFRILYHRHAVLHYQFVFLLYTLCWGILRSVFWLFLPWEAMLELILQGSALLLQFLTFTFLVLFYAQMIYKSSSQWSSKKRGAVILYILVNFLFTAAFVATIIIAAYWGVDIDVIQEAHAFFIAGMYLFLAASLAIFGWRLIYLVSVDNVKIPFLKSKLQISILTMTLCVVFTSRAIKDFLSGLNIGTFNLSDPEAQSVTMQAILFSIYLFWEIIPATLVLVFFWHIPGANKEPAAPVPAPYYSALNINGPNGVSSDEGLPFLDSPSVASKVKHTNKLFNNPRLESDDELVSPVVGKTPSKDAQRSPIKGSNRPHFRQYSGYSTQSPLSLPNSQNTSNNNNTADASVGSPFASTAKEDV